MAAGIKDIAIEAGATFRLGLAWLQPGPDDDTAGEPYNLTGATAQMQIRQRVGADVLIDLDTTSGITLSGETGMIDVLIPWTTTAALTIRKGVYDLFVTFPNERGREKVLKGKVTVDQAVTVADDDDEPEDNTPGEPGTDEPEEALPDAPAQPTPEAPADPPSTDDESSEPSEEDEPGPVTTP